MLVTQERVKELFHYSNGALYRKTKVSNIQVGERAGTKGGDYEVIYVDGRPYKSHRLIWLYIYGGPLPRMIDHIDGNTRNNQIENLREASNAENTRNARRQLPHKKYKGVGFHRGKWRARICKNYQSIFLGHYDTEEEAAKAYNAAAVLHHKEFACPNLLEE